MTTTTAPRSLVIRKGSIAYRILLITRFYRRPITYDDLLAINSDFGKNPIRSEMTRTLKRLADRHLIERHDPATWSITELGIRHLYLMTTPTRARASTTTPYDD